MELTFMYKWALFSARSKDAPEEAPVFPKGLRDSTADEDSPLTFSAPFLGNPVPDVTWSKDGNPLEPSDKITMTCDGTKVSNNHRIVL